MTDLPVPAAHRWVPEAVLPGPPLSVAQRFRRLAAALRTGAPIAPDFGLAVQRHERFAMCAYAAAKGPVRL